MALENVRYVGLAPDPFTGGVATDPEPWFYVDATEVGLDSPTETDAEVPSMMGMTARQKRAMGYIPSGSLGYNTDIRTLSYMLKWGLMGYKFTPAPGGVGTETDFGTHEIWANDVRYFQKLCARVGKDEFEHVFSHHVINSLEGSIEREFLGLSADLTGSVDYEDDLKDVVTDIEPLLPAEYALAFHDINLFIDKDGVVMRNVSDIAMSLGFTIEGNVDSERGVTLGSRFPRRHGSSGRGISLSTELHFDSMVHKRAFWGAVNAQGKGTPGKLGGKTFPVEATIDSGKVFGQTDAYGEATFVWPKCYYNSVPLSPSGREEMSSEVELNVLSDIVTLADGVTQVKTPMYVKVKNKAPNLNNQPV